MEQNNEKVEVVEQPAQAEPAKAQTQIVVSTSSLIALMGMVAMVLFVVYKVAANFGCTDSTFYGVMSIFIYTLPLVGLCWAFLRNRRATFEFVLNAIVFGLAIILI